MRRTAIWCVLCGVTAVLLLTAVSVVPTSTAPALDSVTAPTTAVYRIIRVWEGRLAVFVPHSNDPERVYDTAWRTLPQEERERLQNGIEVTDETMLLKALEDYLS